MAAKDSIHNIIKQALINDGWIITHDPFLIRYGADTLYADLAAERPIAAERNGQKIVVEIKSFTGYSVMQDFKEALGQYLIYLALLEKVAPEYKLYLAILEAALLYDLNRDTIQLILEQHQIPLLVVDPEKEMVIQWIR